MKIENSLLVNECETMYKFLRECDKTYYLDNTKKISDATYDALKNRLLALEDVCGINGKYSDNLGFIISDTFEKVKHPTPMQSMKDIFNKEELQTFLNELTPNSELHLSHKMDGLSLNLIYEKGVLIDALTRGDKEFGERVLSNALNVDGIPVFIGEFRKYDLVEVRGEVQMSPEVVDEVNERENQNYKSARNLASGSLRQLDPRVTAGRGIWFVPFCFGESHKSKIALEFNKFSETLDFLNKIFPYHNSLNQTLLASQVDSIIELYNESSKVRAEYSKAPLDGMVIRVNNLVECESMGYSSSYPNYQRAFKFQEKEHKSKLKKVIWQGSKLGYLSPVGILATPFKGDDGADVERVTLVNPTWLELNNITMESELTIIKSGSIIPKIVKVDGNECVTQ